MLITAVMETNTLWQQAKPTEGGFRQIKPCTQIMTSDVNIIDVREHPEFVGELGHIEGATLVPLASLQIHAEHLNKEKIYLLICRSGKRSAQASKSLVELGFSQVINIEGGMTAWNQAGLPVLRSNHD